MLVHKVNMPVTIIDYVYKFQYLLDVSMAQILINSNLVDILAGIKEGRKKREKEE